MPLPTHIEAYEDIRLILDKVVAQGGGQYILPSPTEAIDWRRRAYKFRKLAHAAGERKYGALVLRLDDCTITFDHRKITGQLLDLDGFPVDMLSLLTLEEVIE